LTMLTIVALAAALRGSQVWRPCELPVTKLANQHT